MTARPCATGEVHLRQRIDFQARVLRAA
jgi:hypothetical protein